MLSAFARLGFIGVASTIAIVLALTLMRMVGFQQVFAEPPHPWFAMPQWHVFKPDQICSAPNLPSSESIVMITAEFRDGDWRINCPEAVTLNELLKSAANPNWLIQVRGSETSHLDKLVEIVASFDREMKFGIYSDSQKVARYLRKKSPQWIYAADPASLIRLRLFHSMWIETAMDFWPDFVVMDTETTPGGIMPPRMADELIRRRKPILWNESLSNEKPPFAVRGVVTSRPNL